jgi:hypothetical protein
MKYALLLLSCLMLATPAWSDHDPALREIEKLIRLRDYSEAVTRLETLAHKGNTEAQYRLAGLYRTGKGVNRDLVEAQELYRRAALAGSPDAQFSLALLIEKLDGSRSEARRWYRKSAAQGDRRAAQKLEQYEGTIEAKNEGITGEEIFNAIRHNDEDLIISLIEGGANLDLIDRNGNSTVIAALLAGWPQLAGILIDNTNLYARPNSRGSRPLHIASARGYRSVVLALLERDVDIDHTDARGDSALTLAVRNKNTEIARLLLDRGSRYDLVNDKKKTAVDLAYADDNNPGLSPARNRQPVSKASRRRWPGAVRAMPAGRCSILRLSSGRPRLRIRFLRKSPTWGHPIPTVTRRCTSRRAEPTARC